MVRIAEAEAPAPTADDLLLQEARRYVHLKDMIASLTKEANESRDRLAEVVEENGDSDDSGSLWLNLPEAVNGILALKRERRVSEKLDDSVAEEILKGKGLSDRCYKLVPVLDQDEVYACLFEGALSEEDIDKMFPKKVTWAMVTSKKAL